MDINSFVIGLAKGKKSGSGYFSTKENDAGGLTYAFKAKESEGGGAELNIAYGDTPPEDTTKLWVKTTEPSGVEVRGDNRVSELTATLKSVGHDMTAAAVGTKIYVFGGIGNTENIQRFDLETGTITTLPATIPSGLGLRGATCAAVGTKIYIFGGTEKQSSYSIEQVLINRIYCFDAETEKISQLSVTLPNKGRLGACAAVGAKIYLGGFSSNANSVIGTQYIYCFDTEARRIETLSVIMPASRCAMGCASVGAKVYWIGGENGTDFYNQIYCLDTENMVVTTVSATVPSVLAYMGCVAIGGKIYLLGGQIGNETVEESYRDSVVCFDTEALTCAELGYKLPTTLCSFGCAAVGEDIYTLGGKINVVANTTKSTKAIVIVPTVAPLESGKMWISQKDGATLFDIVKTDTLQIVSSVYEVYKGNADGIAEPVESALYKDGEWVTI